MNRLNVSLFTPALLFSKVALYLTPGALFSNLFHILHLIVLILISEKLTELYVIPIWFIIVTAVSMLVGSVLGWLFGLKSSQRRVNPLTPQCLY